MSQEYDQVEKYLVTKVKQRGGLCYKLTPPPKGAPDRVALFPGALAVFVETKTEDGRLEPLQKRRINELKDRDFVAVAVYGKEDVDQLMVFIDQMLEGKPA